MKRIIAALAVLALVGGCGGKGGDKDAFCAAGIDFVAAGDDAAAREAALATMADEAPKKQQDSVESLQNLDPESDGYQAASDEVTSFIDDNCDTGSTTTSP